MRGQSFVLSILYLPFNEFHASLTKKPKAAQTCYLRSLYPYPCSLNILSEICDALHNFKENGEYVSRNLDHFQIQ